MDRCEKRKKSIETNMSKLNLSIKIIGVAALVLPLPSLGENHTALNNWGMGSDIMVDAFSNNIMNSATTNSKPVLSDDLILGDINNCDGADSLNKTCSADKKKKTVKLKIVSTPSFSYSRFTLSQARSRKTPFSSYIIEIYIPDTQPEDSFFQGMTSKQFIRDDLDAFLFTPAVTTTLTPALIQKNLRLSQKENRGISTTTLRTSRLALSFSTTDIDNNFSDIDFQKLVAGFAKKIAVTQDTLSLQNTKLEETSTTDLLNKARSDDKSGVTEVIWLEAIITSIPKRNADEMPDMDNVTLSYQTIETLNPESGIKENYQALPKQGNPFTLDSNISFGSPSLF